MAPWQSRITTLLDEQFVSRATGTCLIERRKVIVGAIFFTFMGAIGQNSQNALAELIRRDVELVGDTNHYPRRIKKIENYFVCIC